MTLVVKPEREAHQHNLPWKEGGYGSTGEPDGTLARCGGCGVWFFSAPCFESYGPTERWYRVHWWHWRLKRRINERMSLMDLDLRDV